MRLHIFLLAAAGIASDASASDNSWVQLPRIPFGVPVDVEIAGGFVLAGNKVRGDFQGEWKEIDKTNCAFQGRYSLCRGNGIDRAGIDGSRYVDLNGSGEQEEIYGSAEVFRQLKENYNVSDYDLKEYASSGSGSSLFVGDGNVIVFTASYPTVAVLLVALDSVMPNGDAKKFWRLAWAAKKIIDKNEEGDVSLDSIHGPRSIRSISIVRNVIYATGEGALAWRSEDSGRTWMRVPIVPLDGVDQDSDTLMELGGPERLFVSYNNGVAWDTIPFHSDGRVVYREGGIWNYAIRKSGILVRKSADMGVTWTVVASETLELNGYGLSKWTVTKSGELVLLSDDMTTLWYFNLPSSEWETYCLPVVPGPFRKIRKFGSDYIALQNWGANSKLVGYHNGSWSLIRERIQDFEVGDNRVFVIDSGRNFNPFKCEFEQLYISWGDKNWYENCRPVDGDDGNPMTSLWGREVLMTRDLLKWDTALSYRGLEKCQYGYKGQGIYCSSPSDNISLAKDGSYQIKFASSIDYSMGDDKKFDYRSSGVGGAWVASSGIFDPVPSIDTSIFRVDASQNILVKVLDPVSVSTGSRSKPRIQGQNLVLEAVSGSRLFVEVVSPQGDKVLVTDEIAQTNLSRTIKIPRLRGVSFVRVVVGNQSSILPMAF